jgi:hypothetical protein
VPSNPSAPVVGLSPPVDASFIEAEPSPFLQEAGPSIRPAITKVAITTQAAGVSREIVVSLKVHLPSRVVGPRNGRAHSDSRAFTCAVYLPRSLRSRRPEFTHSVSNRDGGIKAVLRPARLHLARLRARASRDDGEVVGVHLAT